jgi:CRP-like cAMP-binding protein
MSRVLAHCRELPVRTFAAGETIVEEGTPPGALYVLASGSVEVVKGDVQITTASEPGAVFGEMSVLMNAPHTATVRALEPCQLHVADEPLVFLRDNREVAFAVSRLLARRLYFVTTYLADLKRQFEDRGDHLEMVDEVLDGLVHHHGPEAEPGSDRCPDPTVE